MNLLEARCDFTIKSYECAFLSIRETMCMSVCAMQISSISLRRVSPFIFSFLCAASLFCKSFLYIELGTFLSFSFHFISFLSAELHRIHTHRAMWNCALLALRSLGWLFSLSSSSSLFFVLVVQYFEVKAQEICMHCERQCQVWCCCLPTCFFRFGSSVSFQKTTMSLASTSLSQQRQAFSVFHR